jgi:ribonuclease VapC
VIRDTSALVAILCREPEADEFINLINDSEAKLSAASYVETGAVIDRAGDPVASRELHADEALLYKGNDFIHTDVTAAAA